jgi:nifR3 family TIM-barrel protein
MRIGELELEGNTFLAPMAGITDFPFRKTVERFGVSALWTEMISSCAVVASARNLETLRLTDHQSPTICQISGNDPTVMAKAAAKLEEMGAAGIDINMGCPARKVVHSGSGAALMKNVPLAGKIVGAVRQAITVPLTVKIRSGWDVHNQNAPDFAKMIESEGVDAIIIHSRIRSNRHSGPPSLGVIRRVKESVAVPVIGNGGIMDVPGAQTMIRETGCDGIMVGRGSLGRPWFLKTVMASLGDKPGTSVTASGVLDIIMSHFELSQEMWGTQRAVRRMRKHLGWYSRGFANGADFRSRVFREETPNTIFPLLKTFFGKAATI